MRTGRSLLFVAAIFFLLWAPVMASAETIDQVADAIISAYNQYHSTYSGQALYLLQAAYVHAVAAKQYEAGWQQQRCHGFHQGGLRRV